MAIAEADKRGYLRGFEEAKNQGTVAFESLKAMVRSTMQSFATSFDGNVRGETIEFGMALQQSGSPASIQAPAPTRQPVVPPAARQSSPAVSGGGNLSGPEQRIINSLMTWATWGHYQPSNSQVAWLAGYSPSSSSYANPRGALKSKGLLEYPAPDTLQLTPEGSHVGVPMEMSGSLVDLSCRNCRDRKRASFARSLMSIRTRRPMRKQLLSPATRRRHRATPIRAAL
jgi:hypothetical protein